MSVPTTKAKFSESNFAFYAKFYSCDLRYTDFNNLNLKSTTIEDSDCRESRFIKCNMDKSRVATSNLDGAIFSDCSFAQADFSESINVFISPAHNKIKQTKVNSETAIALAGQFGFKIE